MPIGKGTPIEAFVDNLKSLSQLAAQDPATWSPSESLIGRPLVQACQAWSKDPVSNIPIGTLYAFMNDICSDYYVAQGVSGPTVNAPPFSGGQCEDRAYTIRFFRVRDGFPQTFDDVGVYGPILAAEVVFTDNVPPTYAVRYDITAKTSPGGAVTSFSVGPITTPDPNVYVVGVFPQDGLPDNCGSLPTTIEPGHDFGVNWGDTNTYNDFGLEIDVTVNPPQITPDLGIELEAEVGDVAIDLFGGGSNPYQPQPTTPGPGTPDGEPQAGNNNEPVEGEATEGTLRGIAVVASTESDVPRVEFGPPNPLLYNLGWVSFGNSEGYGEHSRIIANNQFFWAPKGADRYQVKFNAFVTGTVQAFIEGD